MMRNYWFAVVVGICWTGSALADEPLTGTLQKIKNSKVLALGIRESSVPFSFYDDTNANVGYSRDLANVVIQAVKTKLGISDLTVHEIPVTSQNRIPLIQNGTIDLEAGSTTNNQERAKQVAFSTNIFVVGTRLLVRKNSGIQDFPDLKGKTVVTTAGTTSERLLHELDNRNGMHLNIISAKDHGEAFLILQSGRAVAFMMDDALLAGEKAKARKPDDWVIVGTPQSKEAYGMMLRRDDEPFKQVVDGAISQAETSGEAEKIYQKWFQSPIPPKQLNLQLPLNEDMKELFKAPNDRPLQ